MATKKIKEKDKIPAPKVKDGAKKYIATMLMLVGSMALFFVFYIFIMRISAPHW